MSRISVEFSETDTRPEAELLLCCARTSMDLERTERIKVLLQKDIDWGDLLRLALPHGMMPLLYWHLHTISPEAVPKDILDRLRDHFCTNTRRNLFLTGELLRLLERLEVHGIPAIPLKGPILAASVYGNLALRQFCDLDILVQRKDIPKTKGLLVSLGYRAQTALTAQQEAASLRSRCESEFVREDGRVRVDIHWELMPKYFSVPLGPDCLWASRERRFFSGMTVLDLSRENLLLFLCVHGFKHCWERLDWLCGAAELIRAHSGMNWERVMRRSDMLGSTRMLLVSLHLANDLLGTALPQEVLQRIEVDTVVQSLARKIRGRLFHEAGKPPGVLKTALIHLRGRERLRDRIRFCYRLALIPNLGDWSFLPLPRPFSFLYYFIRPIRLVGRHVLRL